MQGIKVRDSVIQSIPPADMLLDTNNILETPSTDSIILFKTLTDSSIHPSNNIGAVQYDASITQIVGLTNVPKQVLGPGLYSDDRQTFVNPKPRQYYRIYCTRC